MEKPSSTLSHSISRLLGHPDEAHLDRTDRSSHVASDYGTKEKRKSRQDKSLRTNTERARLQRDMNQELCIYPWMETHRSRQVKMSKRFLTMTAKTRKAENKKNRRHYDPADLPQSIVQQRVITSRQARSGSQSQHSLQMKSSGGSSSNHTKSASCAAVT